MMTNSQYPAVDNNDHTQEQADQKSIKILAAAVSLAIKENKGDARYIDLSKIPLICLGIANMSNDIKEIKEIMASNRKESDSRHEKFLTKIEFSPYRKALNMIAGLAIVAIVSGLLSLVFIK